jgi:hypothetical protein
VLPFIHPSNAIAGRPVYFLALSIPCQYQSST